MLLTKFRIIWQNGFRGEESKKSANHKQESPVVAMFVNGLGQNEQMLPTKFRFIWQSGFRGKDLKK